MGTLDYVCCWFLKASEYVQEGHSPIGFVATNSITQGEQVAELWPLLFNRYHLEITFAHRTFAWGSEARGKANVHVVIVGLAKKSHTPPVKRLFDYENIKGSPTETQVRMISPYLFDAGNLIDPHTVVRETTTPITERPKMIIGSKPIDGGYLIFDDGEKEEFLTSEPKARKYMRPFIGGVEYIQGRGRWILSLQQAAPADVRGMPLVVERLKAVTDYRLGKRPARKKEGEAPEVPGISARSLAATPSQFHVTVIPATPFLAIPENSSETRPYLPIGWLKPPIIPSNKLRFAKDATLWHFSVLTSAIHVAWLRFIGGKIKSDFQYSIGVVYNTFPWPTLSESSKDKLAKLGQAVLNARARYPQSTLADLYDSTTMPADLRKAHAVLDLAVDKLYRKEPFASDRERVEFLLARYEQITAPALAMAANKPKRARAAKR